MVTNRRGTQKPALQPEIIWLQIVNQDIGLKRESFCRGESCFKCMVFQTFDGLKFCQRRRGYQEKVSEEVYLDKKKKQMRFLGGRKFRSESSFYCLVILTLPTYEFRAQTNSVNKVGGKIQEKGNKK